MSIFKKRYPVSLAPMNRGYKPLQGYPFSTREGTAGFPMAHIPFEPCTGEQLADYVADLTNAYDYAVMQYADAQSQISVLKDRLERQKQARFRMIEDFFVAK